VVRANVEDMYGLWSGNEIMSHNHERHMDVISQFEDWSR